MSQTNLFSLGRIEISQGVAELNNCVRGAGNPPLDMETLNELVDKADKEYLDRNGCPQSKDNVIVTSDTASYIRFKLPLSSDRGEVVYGWFSRTRTGIFTGPQFGSLDEFKKQILMDRQFHIGPMYFEHPLDGYSFLKDIAVSTIQESWKYRRFHSKMNFPVLKFYMENTVNQQIREHKEGKPNRLVFSNDGCEVVINSGLLMDDNHDALIIGTVDRRSSGRILICNPSLVQNSSNIANRFNPRIIPLPTRFYQDNNEIVFQPWAIDNDIETLLHVIVYNDRRDRFPKSWGNDIMALAKRFNCVFDTMIAMAKREPRLVAPMYNPKNGKIQFLLPVYLSGMCAGWPHFAVALTPDKKCRLYRPETFLDLDVAYQCARLISVPTASWFYNY